jgi:hypothetical protein
MRIKIYQIIDINIANFEYKMVRTFDFAEQL